MNKIVCIVLFIVILMTATACKNKDDKAVAAKTYYDYLISLGEIETEGASTVGGGFCQWDVNDLYYYIDDFNEDGIFDLAISAEEMDSNGFEIYTYKYGQVEKLFSEGMPFSSGVEIYTIAKYDGKYGIKYFSQNSMGDFAFYRINKDATIKEVFSGEIYDIDGNRLDTSETYEKISPIDFYGIDEFKKMFKS